MPVYRQGIRIAKGTSCHEAIERGEYEKADQIIAECLKDEEKLMKRYPPLQSIASRPEG